jgi:hypothetical protein
MKLGVEYANRSSYSYWNTPGQVYGYQNYTSPQIDIDGDGSRDMVDGLKRIRVYRGTFDDATSNSIAAYFSDTVTFGRMTLLLGARYDYQDPKVNEMTKKAVDLDHKAWQDYFSTDAANAINNFMPGSTIPAVDPDYQWQTLSPRLGITYDVFGTGKTIAKLSYANYGEYMNVFGAWGFVPGGTGGVTYFWVMDEVAGYGNNDGIIDVTELYWRYYGQRTLNQVFDGSGNLLVDWNDAYYWEIYSFDPDDPQAKVDPYTTYRNNPQSSRTNEIIFTVEQELLENFGIAFDFTYRHFGNYNWSRSWDGETEASIDGPHNYSLAGQMPGSGVLPWDPGESAGKDYYLRSPDYQSTNYSVYEPRDNSYYYRTYYGAEIRFNKRLSNKWMLNGSFTLQNQSQHYDGVNYPFNTTNLWAYNDNIWAPNMGGGSGKMSMQVFSYWLAKLSGLYQLPLDFNVSFTFNARQGHPVPRGYSLIDESSPNSAYQSIWVYTEKFGTDRLETFWNLNFRIEKVIRAGDFGRIYLMCDIFNVFNNSMMNRRYDYDYGEFYVDTGFTYNDPYYGLANEVLNPRVFRFGVRFQF